MKKFKILSKNLINKKFVAGIVIIIILIGGAISASIYATKFFSHETFIAVPSADKEIAHVGEKINFTAKNSKGNIIDFSWNFGDGNASNECDSSHTFNSLGWYNVILCIKSKSGKETNSTILIGMQHKDVIRSTELGRMSDVQRGKKGLGIGIEISPNIGLPKIDVHCIIEKAIGTVGLLIVVDTPDETETLYDEEYVRAAREDVQFVYSVQHNNLLADSLNVDVYVKVDQGTFQNAIITITAIFPMENLQQHD